MKINTWFEKLYGLPGAWENTRNEIFDKEVAW